MLKVMILLERNGDLQVFMGIHKVFVEEVPGIWTNNAFRLAIRKVGLFNVPMEGYQLTWFLVHDLSV